MSVYFYVTHLLPASTVMAAIAIASDFEGALAYSNSLLKESFAFVAHVPGQTIFVADAYMEEVLYPGCPFLL